MNKFTSLMMGAALLSLSACSSEELVIDTPDIPQEGSALYLAVNIKSGDMSSRAEGTLAEEGEDEWDFKYGTPDEHKVARADFYFFDANGFYLAQADVWSDGKAVESVEGQKDGSVEYISSNMLVLRGLTKKNPPKYMITVLNDKKDGDQVVTNMIPGVTTMAEFRNKVTTWTVTQSNNNNLMLMTTSSYLEDGKSDLNSLEVGSTELSADQLSDEPIEDLEKVEAVNVYVERLAAKFTMEGARSFEIPVTIGGLPNVDSSEEGEDASGHTVVTVKINGFSVTCTPDQAYYTKHLVIPGAATDATAWASPSDKEPWNDFANHRSYWGKSLYYDKTDATGLLHPKFTEAVTPGNAVYANENTKPYEALWISNENHRVNPNLVTNVVFTATIQIDGEDAELVNYNGIFYTPSNFKQLILNRLQLDKTKPIWVEKESSTDTETNEEGSGSTTTTTQYQTIGLDYFKFARADASVKNGKVTIVCDTEKFDKDKKYYTRDADGKYEEITDLDAAQKAVDAAILALTSGTGNDAEYYNKNTYYTIPVQHLLGSDDNANKYVVTRDGEFGIVRNHWYHFTIGTITKLGHGVFEPEDGDDKDTDEFFPDPDPEKTTYALAAKVNILSWKIVRQTIDI